MFNQSLFTYLVRAMVLLTAIPIHECAHAWASNKLGDPTAKNLGRLTLNPLPHLDLIGSVLMLFTGFGWAKPVPVTTRNFKNVKKGMILTALAGPAANILLALLSLILYKLWCYFLYPLLAINFTTASAIAPKRFFSSFIQRHISASRWRCSISSPFPRWMAAGY